MAHLAKLDSLPFGDYLAQEREVEIRSEYVDGQLYAMAGASEVHNTIAMSFAAAIESALDERCRVWQSDMKVIGESSGRRFAYYPDIMAACGESQGDSYSRSNPLLIVEVLSASTQRVDLNEKFINYTGIATLLEYVVVSQDAPLVRMFRRRTAWQLERYGAADRFTLESVGLEIAVAQIYRRVQREVGFASFITSLPSSAW